MPCPPSVPISVIPPVGQGVGPLVWLNGSRVARLTTPLNPSWLVYDGGLTRWGDGSATAPVLLPNLQQVQQADINFAVGLQSNGQLAAFANLAIDPNNALVTATGSTTARTLANRFADIVNVLDYGAVGDGVTDDTAAIQAAINSSSTNKIMKVFIPSGLYRTTSVLNITSPIVIEGEGAAWIGTAGTINTSSVRGSFIYANHSGKAIAITTNLNTGFQKLASFGIVRDQPAITSGWTPNANDYDIYLNGAVDTWMDGILQVNATKGVYCYGSGRMNVRNHQMEAFQVGFYVDQAYDTCTFDNIHIWPYWSVANYANVQAYTWSNLDCFYILRCDNPFFTNIFSAGSRSGFRFAQSAYGVVSRLHVVDADFDLTKYGVWVDSTVTGSPSCQFENITILGNTIATGIGMYFEGGSSVFNFGNLRISNVQKNAIYLNSANTNITIGSSYFDTWDLSSGGNAAIKTIALTNINFSIVPFFFNITNSSPQYNAPSGYLDTISVPQWLSFTPVITSATGTITSYTVNGAYRYWNGEITISYQISLTNAGTANGSIIASLPISTTTLQQSQFSGRETNVVGSSLTATIISSTSISIQKYDNTFIGSTGYNLSIGGFYRQ